MSLERDRIRHDMEQDDTPVVREWDAVHEDLSEYKSITDIDRFVFVNSPSDEEDYLEFMEGLRKVIGYAYNLGKQSVTQEW